VALLKRAFIQSRRRLTVRSDDSDALHILSRVYLAQADTKHAALSAALSYRTDPTNALPLVTLARCHLVAGDAAAASRIAQRAVDEGATYANEILAQVALKTAGGSQREVAVDFERLRGRVTPGGRLAYLGCAVDAAAAWQNLKSVQADRGRKLVDKVKETGRGLGS